MKLGLTRAIAALSLVGALGAIPAVEAQVSPCRIPGSHTSGWRRVPLFRTQSFPAVLMPSSTAEDTTMLFIHGGRLWRDYSMTIRWVNQNRISELERQEVRETKKGTFSECLMSIGPRRIPITYSQRGGQHYLNARFDTTKTFEKMLTCTAENDTGLKRCLSVIRSLQWERVTPSRKGDLY